MNFYGQETGSIPSLAMGAKCIQTARKWQEILSG